MKIVYSLILFCILSGSQLFGQVIEKDFSMSEGVQNSFLIELNGANKRKAENLWKRYIKDYGKSERNRKTKEYLTRDVIIPSIDNGSPVTIYSKFDEYDNMTRVHFWIKMDERFINSIDDENQVNGVDVFLNNYSVLVEKDVVKDELNKEEKQLKRLQKEFDKLEKRNKNLHKDIEKARETILKSEKNIETNILEQEEVKLAIAEQTETVKSVSDKMNKVGNN